jgi:hypothetical protein
MKKDASLRIALDAIVFISVLLGWWFVAIPVGIVGAWVFPRYAELVIAGFIYDVLYSMPHGMGGGMSVFGYAYVASSAIILAVIAYLKVVVKNNT